MLIVALSGITALQAQADEAPVAPAPEEAATAVPSQTQKPQAEAPEAQGPVAPIPTLRVKVQEVDAGRPVPAAEVMVKDRQQTLATGITDERGIVALHFTLQEPEEHTHHLIVKVIHGSYEEVQTDLEPGVSDLAIRMFPVSAFSFGSTAVIHTDVLRPRTALEDLELHENFRANIPETIASVPGVAAAYNGPGAARPTIRGLGGDRVLMLDDGYRVGDLYWSASDHGVMFEPLLSQRIEVVRGPATLVYGGNALGGVVNVVTDQIPKHTHQVSTNIGTQFESATRAIAQAGSVVVPMGPVSLRLEESVRRSTDVRTPDGQIPNTGVKAFGGGGGLAWHPNWGMLGASVRYYQNSYGVPGEFDGVLIEGGHPGGANIEARRLNARLLAKIVPSGSSAIENAELGASITRYRHDEIEGIIDGRRALGAAFQLDTLQSNLIVRHELLDTGKVSIRGAGGVSMSATDLVAGGSQPGVRSGSDWGVAGFLFERLNVKSWSFHAGLRYEHRRLAPDNKMPIEVRTDDRVIEKTVTDRNYNLLSGSLAALWEFSDGWTLGTTVARSSRAPNLQELYSDGPHLADFSYDIGSPDLPVEAGTGLDLFLLADLERVKLELTGFLNFVDNYVIYTPTLETIRVFREGVPPRDTPVYEALAVNALFLGVETRVRWKLGAGFSLDTTLSYVWAERRDNSDPLPFVPPLNGRATLRYEHRGFFITAGVSGALRQSRVPRAIDVDGMLENPQEPTAGYVLAHASLGWRWDWLRMTHTATLAGANIANGRWRDHLSRIKDVAPQTGLNISLTYQLEY